MRSNLNLGMRGILLARAAPIIRTAAYANDFDAIMPDLYTAMAVVSRELIGFIPAAMRAPSVERAAVGQAVSYLLPMSTEGGNIVPSMAIPEPADIAPETGSMTITKSRYEAFGITGEEQRGINAGGENIGFQNVQQMWIGGALRKLFNEMERDLAVEATSKASRAYGTAGTTPFGGDKMTDTSFTRKILDDNGAPAGRSLILNTSAGANMRSMFNLTRANEAGTTMTLRSGTLLELHDFNVRESGQSVLHTKGTGALATTNATGYAVGSTVINLANAGTGNVLPGDVISFAGDPNKYVVRLGDADVSGGGTITLAAPGLMRAIPAAATAITLAASYEANVAFSQTALHLATRLPALPNGKDAADDATIVTDPYSGLSVEFRAYYGYRKARFEAAIAWGVHASQSEHIALLLG